MRDVDNVVPVAADGAGFAGFTGRGVISVVISIIATICLIILTNRTCFLHWARLRCRADVLRAGLHFRTGWACCAGWRRWTALTILASWARYCLGTCLTCLACRAFVVVGTFHFAVEGLYSEHL